MLPEIRLHDLRHTHATLALRAGVHPKVVSERFGHGTVAITLDTYSHAIPAMQEEAAMRIAALGSPVGIDRGRARPCLRRAGGCPTPPRSRGSSRPGRPPRQRARRRSRRADLTLPRALDGGRPRRRARRSGGTCPPVIHAGTLVPEKRVRRRYQCRASSSSLAAPSTCSSGMASSLFSAKKRSAPLTWTSRVSAVSSISATRSSSLLGSPSG